MPLEVAIIGAGFARTAILPALATIEGVDVVALASARMASARSAADEFRVPAAYDDWEEMLARHRVDLVYIGTPTHTHAPMALAALEAGAHVLSEKPMALDRREAATMLERAEALGRLHMIDHELRFNPNRRRIKALIDEGAIGTVRHVNLVDVNAAFGDPASRREGDWLFSAGMGGGRLGGGGSHQIDLLRWWLGDVVSVSGHLTTMVPDRSDPETGRPWSATADDFASFTMKMFSGALVDVLVSGVARHETGSRIEVYGSEGTIMLVDERLLVADAGEKLEDLTVPDEHTGLPGIQRRVWNISVVSLLKELTNAIRESRPLREGATFADGLRCQEVMDAVRRSSVERRWVDVAELATASEAE